MAQRVKRLSTMRETQVQSLGREDPLEKEIAVHSSTIAWKIPWTEEPGRLQSMGWQRVGCTERLHFQFLSLSNYEFGEDTYIQSIANTTGFFCTKYFPLNREMVDRFWDTYNCFGTEPK